MAEPNAFLRKPAALAMPGESGPKPRSLSRKDNGLMQVKHNDTAQLPGAAYATESTTIRDAAEDIGAYLALWSMRDDSKPCAEARRAANDAMDAIDKALAELHALRARLVGDIRVSDDAAMVRTAALLEPAVDLAAVTADERGEYPGDVEEAAGSLPWVLSEDQAEWWAELPDGRTAVVEHPGDGHSFLPKVYESRGDFEVGPVCASALGAAAWCAERAAAAQ